MVASAETDADEAGRLQEIMKELLEAMSVPETDAIPF
jgi:hypothetical protein